MKSLKRKKKILVCDDDESILEVLEIILTENNFKVITIKECETILNELKAFHPDLILLDVWMKSCDGRVIAGNLLDQPRYKDLPIIFISALNELDELSMTSNVKDFIKKPFEADELIKKINDVLG